MPKRSYYGVANTARRIKKIYIGVDGVARKVRKAYVGVNGVARPFFTGGEVKYYGSITPLSYDVSTSDWTVAAAAVCNNYGIFAGGEIRPFKGKPDAYNTKCWDTVTAYSRNLTQVLPAKLPEPRGAMLAESVSDYAIFAGGLYVEIKTNSTGIGGEIYQHPRFNAWAYNKALTCTTITDVPKITGAYGDGGSYGYPTVNIAGNAVIVRNDGESFMYNSSLTQMRLSTLNFSKVSSRKFAKAGRLAVLGAALPNPGAVPGADVYAIDENFVRYIPVEGFQKTRLEYGAASNITHAIFVGGHTYHVNQWDNYVCNYDQSNYVDAYDESLTKINAGVALYPCAEVAGGTLSDCAVFAGIRGNEWDDRPWNTSSGARYMMKYDSKLTCTHVVGNTAHMANPHKRGVSVCFSDIMLIAGSAVYLSDELTDGQYENYYYNYECDYSAVDAIILD